MSKQQILDESRLVTMTDAELVEAVGTLFESIKRLDEQMKSDPEIERMVAELNEYKAGRYLDNKKAMSRKLKAARAHARIRGLQFKLPKTATDDGE
jgi:uncharacterized small protein (DUF1192 family)